MKELNEIQSAPKKENYLTQEERGKLISDILEKLEILGIIPPEKKGGDQE